MPLNITRVLRTLESAAGDALYEAVDEVVRPVVMERIPYDKGDLSETVAVTRDGTTTTLSAGNPSNATGAIAVVQHERLDYRHASGRTAKYIENPSIETAPALAKAVAAKMRSALN